MAYDDLKQVGEALQQVGVALARLAPTGGPLVPVRTPVPMGADLLALVKSDTEGPESGAGSGKDTAKSNPVPTQEAPDAPKSLFWDPFAIVEQLGYKDRPSQVTYGTLKAIAWKTPVVHAVINTRVQQVASFSKPQHDRYQWGFRIKLRDSQKEPTKAERKWMLEMETLISRTGVTKHPRGRENFESFLRKLTWDSLVYDQMCHLAGTLVELADGQLIPIEAIESGMLVRTHKGRIQAVEYPTQRRYSGKMVRLQVRAQVLEVTEGHPFLVAQRTSDKGNTVKVGQPEWKPAGEITEDDYLVYRVPVLGTEEVRLPIFDKQPRRYATGDVEKLAEDLGVHRQTVYQILTGTYPKNGPSVDRVLTEASRRGISYETKRVIEPTTLLDEQWGRIIGLYLAEGNVAPRSVRFTFTDEVPELVDEIIAFGNRYGIGHTLVDYDDRAAITVILNSDALADFFKKFFGTGSREKHIPDFVFKLDRGIRNQILWGYLRGDGHIREGRVSFNTVSPNLFGGIRILFAAERIYVSQVHSTWLHDHYPTWSEQYSANISGPEYNQWAIEVGLPAHLDAKNVRRTVIVCDQFLCVKVSKRYDRMVEDLLVFNMDVAEDHSYVANGVVSHNCFEIVPNKKGDPAEWYAVDASTIRLADTASTYMDESREDAIRYVQIYDGMVIAEFNQNELCFGVRNPRTDIRLLGYGVSELELLVPTVTSLLWGFEYNQKFFSQGSSPKGIINFKGVIPERQLQQFRRHWYQMCSGVENAWRTPVVASDDLQYVNLQQSNRDMEFNAWLDFLIKIACSMYSMDPVEVNFQYGNVGQKSALQGENNKEKITESRERGLRPILRFLAEQFNQFIVWPINEAFEFAFVGLDAQTKDQSAELNSKRVKTMMTVDELRAEDDLAPLPDGRGELILDPTYLQWAQLKEGQGQEGAPGAGGDMGEGEPEGDGDFESLLAQYEKPKAGSEKDKESQEGEAEKSLRKSRVVVNIDL